MMVSILLLIFIKTKKIDKIDKSDKIDETDKELTKS